MPELQGRAKTAVAKPEVPCCDEFPEALREHGAARGAVGRQAGEDLVGHEVVSEDGALTCLGCHHGGWNRPSWLCLGWGNMQ
jgi:hypothetical protein